MTVNLIVTLGDRDLVLKQEIEGVKCRQNSFTNKIYLDNNVEGAKILTHQFSKVFEFIDFPILLPAIDYVLDKHEEIHNLILVGTNQELNADVSDFHKKKDTYELVQLVKLYVKKKYKPRVAKILECIVTNDIIYHDIMFDEFAEKLAKPPFDFRQEDDVYLFAQSGIDAINTALLLNCIEQYPQTIQLNKPENSSVAFQLHFPEKFYKRLISGKVLHAIENYNYAAVFDLNYDEKVTLFSKYAFSRLTFDFDKAKQYLGQLCHEDPNNRSYYINLSNQLDFKETGMEGKLVEMYISAKVLLKRYAYSDFLVRIFSLTEILLKPKVAALLGGQIKYKASDNHQQWNDLLAVKPDLLEHLKECKFGKKNLDISYPNKLVYKKIVDFYDKKNNRSDASFDLLYNHLSTLSDLRNKVAHEMIKVNETDINEALKKRKTDLDGVLALADNYFGVNGMGDYDEINQKLVSML